ncbi:MAG: hypothetical protein FWD69_09785 [Polyangiaceae bacterium]|nr:hypothetical protein [Polyangiaceae bacterium]
MKTKTWVAVVLAVGLSAGRAQAQADEDMLDAATEARIKEGMALAKAHEYAQARISFLQALGLSPGSPKVLLNLAICEQDGELYVEALGHLREYLASPRTNPRKAKRMKETMYEDLWRATGHLRISADRGEAVLLDSVKFGNAPLPEIVDVEPGRHHVTASGRTVHVTVAAGEIENVDLTSPAPVQRVMPVVLPPRREARESYWTGKHVAGVTAGGLAVVAAGVGVGFLAVRANHVSDGKSIASDPNTCVDTASEACTRLRNGQSSAKTAAVVSGVSFGAAVVLGVTAGYLLWPKHHKESSRRVHARVIPTWQGVVIDGDF